MLLIDMLVNQNAESVSSCFLKGNHISNRTYVTRSWGKIELQHTDFVIYVSLYDLF